VFLSGTSFAPSPWFVGFPGHEEKEKPMDPLRISAQFAAYMWYCRRVPAGQEAEAAAFARRNWPKFLSLAHAGLGRLLGKIAAKTSKASDNHTSATFKIAKLKTLAKGLNKSIWAQAR
jgi:hypothetical protein